MVIHNDWGLFFQCNGVILHNIFLLNCKISWTHYVSLTQAFVKPHWRNNWKKCVSQDDVLECLVLATAQKHSVYCPENQKIFRIIKLQSEWKKSSNLLIHFKKYLATNWLIITALGPMLYFKMDKIKHICIYEKEILIVPCSASRTTSICPL